MMMVRVMGTCPRLHHPLEDPYHRPPPVRYHPITRQTTIAPTTTMMKRMTAMTKEVGIVILAMPKKTTCRTPETPTVVTHYVVVGFLIRLVSTTNRGYNKSSIILAAAAAVVLDTRSGNISDYYLQHQPLRSYQWLIGKHLNRRPDNVDGSAMSINDDNLLTETNLHRKSLSPLYSTTSFLTLARPLTPFFSLLY